MRILIIAIMLSSISFAQSAETDSTQIRRTVIGFDKYQHAAVSCLLTLSSQYIMENKSNLAQADALPYAVNSSVMVGLTKELNDWQNKQQSFNWGDMIANGIGIAIGVLIITL